MSLDAHVNSTRLLKIALWINRSDNKFLQTIGRFATVDVSRSYFIDCARGLFSRVRLESDRVCESRSPEVVCRPVTKATEQNVRPFLSLLSYLLPPWLLRAFLFSLLTRSLHRWFKGEVLSPRTTSSPEFPFPPFPRAPLRPFLVFSSRDVAPLRKINRLPRAKCDRSSLKSIVERVENQ